jgi:hypothetical protein
VSASGVARLRSALDFLVPIAIYLMLGERAHRLLDRARVWMVGHTGALTIGMFLFLGIIFLGRGIGKL